MSSRGVGVGRVGEVRADRQRGGWGQEVQVGEFRSEGWGKGGRDQQDWSRGSWGQLPKGTTYYDVARTGFK